MTVLTILCFTCILFILQTDDDRSGSGSNDGAFKSFTGLIRGSNVKNVDDVSLFSFTVPSTSGSDNTQMQCVTFNFCFVDHE